MRRYSTSYIIREVKIKTKNEVPLTTNRMVKIQNIDNTPKCWWECGATELSLVAGGNAKRYSHCGRQFGGFV